jgi:hypothetical protein
MKKLLVLSVFAALAIACGDNGNKPPTDPSGSTNTTSTAAPSASGAPSTPGSATPPDPTKK